MDKNSTQINTSGFTFLKSGEGIRLLHEELYMSKLKKALEKAKEAREAVPSTLAPHAEKARMGHNGVHVTYSRTKVVNVDPRILRKNKVVSLFHENETTDQLNILRTQILNKLKEIGGNSLLVTSANPSEGKTFTTINLGVSIAQELDRTVLLVDADLRHPSIHHYDFANDFFGVHITKGLSDYLLGQVDIPDLLINPGIQKLTILPGGRPLPNSSELIASSRMQSLVKEMKSRYTGDRIIIFDSPSLLVCTDPVVLSQFVDAILLVVEAERTSPNDIKRAMELLKGKHLVGTILNKVTP